ncbi:MAG: sugar transferase [Sphingomonadales bacterium]|nr:sugar transferase [Sphingomonadales bacterium]
MSVGVVPGGDTSRLLSIEHIRWIPLDTVDADVNGLSAIAVDLRTNLSEIWGLRLADFALAGLPVYHSKHLQESLTGRVELEHLSENSFGTLSPVSAYMTFKHAVDWLMALVVAVLLMPALLLISLLIVLDSRGSPIFRQRRIGYRGRPFVVWKFRTMTTASSNHSDADNVRTAAMTSSNDRRITRVGHFLRKSRLDELPQIVNVLKREMSWIGPRPEAEVLSQWYEAEIPFYRYRHIVRPGISGWAQVNQGHVAEVDAVRDKLYYDFYYIKHFSPWIDLLIVARTIRTMLTGFGAR